MEIEANADGTFWVVTSDGEEYLYRGPYKRHQDAKGVRTRLLNG